MKTGFELRAGEGLLACAHYLSHTRGDNRLADTPTQARYARGLGIALFHLTQNFTPLAKEQRAEFWRAALTRRAKSDTTPLEWRRAHDLLIARHGAAIRQAAADESPEATVELYKAARAVTTHARVLENSEYGVYGFLLYEIAEARSRGYTRKGEITVKPERDFISSCHAFTVLRARSRIFAMWARTTSVGRARVKSLMGARRARYAADESLPLLATVGEPKNGRLLTT